VAGGGAWLDGKAKLQAGPAGAIQLAAASHDGATPSSVLLGGTLAGWGLAQGGSLSLASSQIAIGNPGDAPLHADSSALLLAPAFFQQGGFANYSLTANRYGLKLADNTTLAPRQYNLALDSTAAQQPSGTLLLNFATPSLLPDAVRQPANLKLALSQLQSQDRGQILEIGAGAGIQTDPQGSLQLDSDTSVQVDGSLSAPGGRIAININTPSAGDKGFYDSQGIWLGAASRLLAGGAFLPTLNGYGLKTGTVLPGGTVTLTAKRGYIVSRAGSLIDVSGTAEQLDFQQTDGSVSSQRIASAGGSIALQAGEGMLFDGGLRAASGGNGAAGGSLSAELNRGLRNKPLFPISGGQFPDDLDSGLPRSIVIDAAGAAAIPASLAQGGGIDSAQYSGRALFGSAQLNQAGFDSLAFKTDVLGAAGTYAGNIQFKGDVHLAALRRIVLDTPTLKTAGGQVELATAYAALGSTQSRIDTDQGDGSFSTTLAPAAKPGSGRLSVSAQGIDLIGGLSFNGFGQVELASQGDVRTIGIRTSPDTKNYLGELKLAGNLAIQANQMYPATLSDYRITLAGGNGDESFSLAGNGATPAPVYSAGGKLTINAANIRQGGVLQAPFGSLALAAGKQLELMPGSLSSVSGHGLTVPFGQGSGGMNWLYPLDSTGNTNLVIAQPPAKRISLSGPNIALQPGAKVDLSGGGDLYAYEFIAGPGGSTDVLDANATGYIQKYAVLPNLGKALTPYDPQEFAASGLSVGDSVYLAPGSALPAGWYTLLPAHYALLPGAYLVTPQAGSQDLQPGLAFTDPAGATVVAGRYGAAATGNGDTRWQGFAVEPGSVARTRSQYSDYLANAFFAAQASATGITTPSLPQDAGSLALNAKTGLSLGAELAAAPAGGGLGGQVDISATHLAIIGRREDEAADTDSTVYLLADDLNRLQAPSLLLGGIRSQGKSGRRLSVAAQTLDIAGDAALQGAEILLAAQNTLHLHSGAVVASSGKSGGAGIDLQVSNQGQNNSDGALLRVSSAGQGNINRDKGVTGKSGTLIVDSGARLAAEQSMLLDSTQNTVFDGSLDMRGGSLALRSSQISLGDAPAGTPGLVLASARFTLDELRLSSAGKLAIYSDAAVDAGSLAIDAAQISGFGQANASFNAGSITLANTAAKAAGSGDGGGTLALNADEIRLGNGSYAMDGFSQVRLSASQTLKGINSAQQAAIGRLRVAGDLFLSAGHYSGDAGATTSVDAAGYSVVIASSGPANPAWPSGLGASWSINGDSLRSSGRFDLPSGSLQLAALQGDINLESGSRIDVSGRALAFAELVRYAPAGTVLLSASQGDVRLAAGAAIDLSGAAQNGRQMGDAGTLEIRAPGGQFFWNGSLSALNGAPGLGLRQGEFRLDAAGLGGAGFSAFNRQLAAAGFSEALSLELRSGDIAIGAGDTVSAQRVQLIADQGQVSVDGRIDAGGAQAGSVSIYGRNGIRLGAGGKILAGASADGEDGGSVTLDSVHRDDGGSGLLDLAQAGGLIDVSGGKNGAGGSVHLRTGRDDSRHSIAVSAIRAGIHGTDPEHTVLEAARVYSGVTSIDSGRIDTWQQDTSAFMQAAPSLANSSGSPVSLLPGLEIRSAGTLSLAEPWDLLSWRYSHGQEQGLPGFLTLRAGGDLNIKATLSDAFATASIPGQSSSIRLQDLLQPGRSWSYSLIAGGNVKLAPSYLAPDLYGQESASQVMVRTGTGSIAIQAGGDIRFSADANDPSAAAAVYSMGRPAEYTRGQLLSGQVPGVPARLAGETDAAYLNRLDPQQMNSLLRYGYFSETLLGLVFSIAEYPSQGGDLSLRAGGNVQGIATGQKISDWLVRSGAIDSNHRPTAWGINVSGDRSNPVNGVSAKGVRYFNQNLGALGGGNVSIEAGGDVRNLSAMLPATGKPFGQLSDAANQWSANGSVANGGGDLQVRAGGNITGGEYYVGLGSGSLSAGGSIAASSTGLGTLLELGDASFSLSARRDVVVGSVFNPTVLAQTNLAPLAAGGDSLFFSYGADSAVRLASTAGNIVLQNDSDAIRWSKNLDTSLSSGFEYAVYPSSLRATAYAYDVLFGHSMTLFPSAQGKLELLAQGNIGTGSAAAQLIDINMSDADPALLPSPAAPAQQLEGSLSDGLIRSRERLDPATPDAALIHAAVPLHSGDPAKPAIIAQWGDIAFPSSAAVTFYLPQAAEFSAGRDIGNLSLSSQNLASGDATRIRAGRHIAWDALIDGDGIVQANDKQIELGGPGLLQIQAGGGISLGGSAGINTLGNTKNTVLPAGGAGIDVLAGIAGPVDYAGFIAKYFAAGSAYLEQWSWIDAGGVDRTAGLPPAQKLALLQQLPPEQQQKPVLDALFKEIKLAAAQAAAAAESQRKTAYQPGFDAIATLFPGDAYQGGLSLVFSQIKTLAGGDINLAVPGGAVNVGLAGKVAGIQKGADQLGIVAQQAGAVNAVSQGDFNVNQSRVFTMGGGDIAIWSSQGNIDAGKGAKSAISAPPPITSVDAKGNVVTIFPPVVSGSGIQTITPQGQAQQQGNVYLAAPGGIVDAGEAGISGGQIVIAATAVVGASNISASGGSVGVPSAVAPPVVPAGAASAAAGAAKSATQDQDGEATRRHDDERKKATVSQISADVIGYGDCSVSDVREGKAGCGG
jgi:hypothetical protein